jgi:lipoprotein-anchoring transpeptidase ErfK/SrfK/putative cell wall-binding protein
MLLVPSIGENGFAMRTRARFRVLGLLVLSLAALAHPLAASAATIPEDTVYVKVQAARIAGADRYATAVKAASSAFPGWADVTHVVVASGEEAGAPDALAASGLCWAYRAPLLLTSGDRVPGVVRAALADIVATNGSVTVHVVGGSSRIGWSVSRQLADIIGPSGSVERVHGPDRYATAAAIASRMQSVSESNGTTMAPAALIAEGGQSGSMADALVLSAVTARVGAPLLLVQKSSVPAATTAALAALSPEKVYVAGGSAVISWPVVGEVAGHRWAGSNRYATAVAVARGAVGNGWLTTERVGIAAELPDALSGSSAFGLLGRPMLLTDKERLPEPTARYLAAAGTGTSTATAFGGRAVIADGVLGQLGGAPAGPQVLVGEGSTQYVAAKTRIKIATGVNTSSVKVWKDGALLGEKLAASYTTVDFGEIPVSTKTVTIKVEAKSPDGKTTSGTRRLTSLGYAWKDYIVIDKSDFRLYLVRNGVLVDTYPIAIGRDHMETPAAVWRIDAKYFTDPAGVYGPRKMRLFRRVGSSYVFTAYGIHGTNQPWVIGTKASHGCIRLYNHDILELFPKVPLGTMVVTRE